MNLQFQTKRSASGVNRNIKVVIDLVANHTSSLHPWFLESRSSRDNSRRDQMKDPVRIKWFPFHPGRDGCRTPMQWGQDENAGFSSNEPWLPIGPEIFERNVADQKKDPHSMFNYTRDLIWLRKELPALVNGSYYSLTEKIPAGCYCFMRKSEEQSLIICLNFSSRRQEISLEWLNVDCRVIASTNPNTKQGLAKTSLKLEGLEGLIIMVA